MSSQSFYRLLVPLLVLSVLACQPPTVPVQQTPTSRWNRVDFTTQQTRTLHTHRNGAKYIGGVPFVNQGEDNTCGQAVMTMLLNFHGKSLDYQQVVNENNPLNVGTPYLSMQNYLRSKGLEAQSYHHADIDTLLTEIEAGRPAIVLLEFEGSLFFTHYVLVVGYNSRRRTLILHESQSAPYVELPLAEFLELWEAPSLVNFPLLGGEGYRRLLITAQASLIS